MSTGPDLDLKRRIKESNDIVQVIGAEFQLRRQGANYVCHCPWHDDQRPSLQVNPVRQSWVCWVCDIRGDVFDYVMRRENMDFREAMEYLADRVGIPMTYNQKKAKPGSPQDKKTLFKATAWVEQQFHYMLTDSDAAAIVRDYLAERGITEQSIQEFNIGFAPASYTWLLDRARNSEFSPEVLEACGLVVRNDRGWYERFRGRVIFPIRDTSNRPIAFGGRVVPSVFPEGKEPPGKYINSPETRLFSKSETLYALNMVRDAVSKSRSLTVVEGYTDVVAAWQVGLRNVVACLGVALNEKHIRVIKRFADQVTLVLDGDEAGQRRANQILDLFVAEDIDMRILTLPENADPFDFVMENGKGAFTELVQSAPDAMTHKIRLETRGVDLANDSHRSNQALERILETLAKSPVAQATSAARTLRQDQILTRLARQFQLDLNQIRRRLMEIRAASQKRFRPAAAAPVEPVPVVDFAKLDRKEVELIELILEDATLIDWAIESVSPGQFAAGPMRDIYDHIIELFHDGQEISYDRLLLDIEKSHLKDLVVKIGQESEAKNQIMGSGENESTDKEKQLELVIRAFHNIALDSESRAKISQLQARQIDEKEEASELEQLLQQAKQRQGL